MTAVAYPRPRPAARPSLGDLWHQAGGGTDAYDADRYVALLREHSYIRERRGLVAILDDVLGQLRASHRKPMAVINGADIAPLLVDGLSLEGYRIHDITRCVRPAGPDPMSIGRPMTPDEEAALLPADAATRARSDHPRRRS